MTHKFPAINNIPSIFKQYNFEGINLDIGGGPYETATNYLAESGVRNLVYDPLRPKYRNDWALSCAEMARDENRLNSITINNVLNVIESREERIKLLEFARSMLGNDTILFIQVYEKRRDGIWDGTQTNMKAADYIPEVEEVFPEYEIKRSRNIIIV